MSDRPQLPSGSELSRRVICLSTTPTMQRAMMFDAISPGEENRTDEVLEFASGKAINVARVLHTLGEECLFIGPSGGERGRQLRRNLDESGIAADLVESDSMTRLCVTVVNRARRQATELVEENPPLSPNVAALLLQRLEVHLSMASVLVLSGSLAPGVPLDFYAQALRMAKQARVRTLLDARGEALKQALAEQPDIVKPNRPELAATIGRPVESRNSMREAMQALAVQGAGWVVVTRGRDGSTASDGVRVWEITTPWVEMISPIGSGDAYAAGLAVALRDTIPLPGGCRLAAACGAANAETPRAGFLEPMRVTQLVEDVVIREIA